MESRLGRRRFLGRLSQTLLGGGAATLGGYMYGTRVEAEWLELERVQVPLRGLGSRLDGFRVVYMSDFHLYPHTQIELIQQAVNMANSLKPDLVILGGDYVLSSADSIFDLAPVLSRLNASQGVFAVLGNHDHWKNDQVVSRGLVQSGLSLLRNQGLTLSVGGERLYLAGLDDGWVGLSDLSRAMEGWSGAPTLLLMHEPDFADQFSADPRISLQLSGHSHGGQVRFPGLGSPFCPRYGKKYDLGLYRVGGMWLYTNRGIGVTAPIRLNCRPEVTEITLVAGDPAA